MRPRNVRLLGLAALAAVEAGCNGHVISFNSFNDTRGGGPDGPVVADAEPPKPTELPLTCQGPISNVTLAVPCAIGMKPVYATECHLTTVVDPRRPAVVFISALVELSRHLNE